eukprot:2664664-Prymnesium_polylepis.1
MRHPFVVEAVAVQRGLVATTGRKESQQGEDADEEDDAVNAIWFWSATNGKLLFTAAAPERASDADDEPRPGARYYSLCWIEPEPEQEGVSFLLASETKSVVVFEVQHVEGAAHGRISSLAGGGKIAVAGRVGADDGYRRGPP